MKILIVDNHAEMRMTLKNTLESSGYEVEECTNGVQALAKAYLPPHPDLIISDVLMPIMDGFTLCRAIRQDSHLKMTPFLIYSEVFESSEDKQLARNIGVSAFLTNPTEPGVLLTTIETLVDQINEGNHPSQDGWLDSYVDERHHQIVIDKLIAKTQELDKTRNTLTTLLNNLPGMVYRCNNDSNWTMRFLSRGCETLTGYTPGELAGSKRVSYLQLIHPDDQAYVTQQVEQAIASDQSYQIEYRIVRKDQEERWVWEQGQCVDRNSSPQILEGYIIDITQQHRDREALEKNRRQIERAHKEWESAFDAINDPVFLHDKDGRILRANKAYAERAQQPIDQLIGRHYWKLFPKTNGQLPKCSDLINDNNSKHTLFEDVMLENGELFQYKAFRINDDNGNYLFSLHVLNDITKDHQQQEQLKKTLVDTITAIARTVEKRDPYTAGHQQRVAELSVAIAAQMGLNDDQIEGIRLGALIHDIGKIYIPSEILNRPGKLTDIEFDLIRTHCGIGFEIVQEIQFPWPIAQMIQQHHERIDGSGYPQGLKDDQIILEAKIMAVADVIEAINSHRPYRPGLGIEVGLNEILKNSDILYDKKVVDAALILFRDHNFSFHTDQTS
ncbi:MAG: HD domain-containing phosphohydrolase [Candidatus Thiodiazotropha sp. DIVDIV]